MRRRFRRVALAITAVAVVAIAGGVTRLPPKKVLPPTVPVGTSGGRTFVEPISLSSTDRIDFRLPATAFTVGFGLLASRTRRRQDTKGGQQQIQGPGRAKIEKFSLFANFSFFHISTAIRTTCGKVVSG
jgi:hypothetical protein